MGLKCQSPVTAGDAPSLVREEGGSTPPWASCISCRVCGVAGMWVWSVKNSDSKPRSSTAGASSSGRIANSAGKIVIPSFTAGS
jgi:hypothetical protein